MTEISLLSSYWENKLQYKYLTSDHIIIRFITLLVFHCLSDGFDFFIEGGMGEKWFSFVLVGFEPRFAVACWNL